MKKFLSYKIEKWVIVGWNTWVNQKFCTILVIWGTIWQLLMLLSRSWRWWTALDCKMPCSSATHRICFSDLEHSLRIHRFRLTWTCLIFEVLATWAKFFEIFALWLTVPSPSIQQNILAASATLWPSSNS